MYIYQVYIKFSDYLYISAAATTSTMDKVASLTHCLGKSATSAAPPPCLAS